jgi:hypothetical protein
MTQRKFFKLETLKAERVSADDVRSERPSTVTSVQVKEQIDKCISGNRR